MLRQRLRLISRHPHVGEVRQRGYMVGIELVQDKATKLPYPLPARIGHRVALHARRQGLIIRPIGSVIILMPPLSVTQDELVRMVKIVLASIDIEAAPPAPSRSDPESCTSNIGPTSAGSGV